MIELFVMAVSYTHLDVYKRQVHGSQYQTHIPFHLDFQKNSTSYSQIGLSFDGSNDEYIIADIKL